MRQISESVSVKCDEDLYETLCSEFVPDSFNVYYVDVIPNIRMNLPLSFFWHVTLHELVDLKLHMF